MKKFSHMSTALRRALVAVEVLTLSAAGIMPLLGSQASAAVLQLSSRSATSSSAVPGALTQLVFTFTTTDKGTATNVKQIEIEFCDQPLGTCTATQTPTLGASPTVTMGGTWAGATPVITRPATGRSGVSNNQFNIVYGTAGNENNKTGLTITLPTAGSDVTNFGTANKTYYPRLRLYSDTGTTLEWSGNVAQSTSQTLTVNARVQELLSFCVGSTAIDNATSQIVPDCTTASGTSVDLGTITNSVVAITPVSSTTGGDANNAYAMVQTNSQNGVTISYHSLQNTSSGKLKVVGATCSGTSTTDQCFNSVGTTQAAIVAGTESYGMTIAGVNCGSVPGSAYTCTYASGRTNLQPQTNYIGNSGYTYSDTGAGSGTYTVSSPYVGQGFAWDDTGTAQTLASSASSVKKVVVNEALVLKFAATAQVTTPTGQYQTQADFIATPTF